MLEDQVAYLLQRYLGNYVKGLSKEALKISVWKGDVELTNMQLKPEALNALKLPIKVKAGFLGSVKLKVPWSRLGQEPVLVHLDHIYLLAEPGTQVEGSNEDAVQEAKRNQIRETELKLLESRDMLKSDMNKSWLGSVINTVIGNLKLSISNIHIRYEDLESNPGHPFAAGVLLEKLLAVTVDDSGQETFVTGGALEHIHKSVELERLAVYLDSDTNPLRIDKSWDDLLPWEWSQIFKFGAKDEEPTSLLEEHSYVLQPVSGNAKYSKQHPNQAVNSEEPLQKAEVNLDDVTLCLSKSGYRDMLRLAENFAAFNQRLKYAHYRPRLSVISDPRSWWKYAFKAVSDQLKKASGKMSWEQVLRYTSLRKKYISLYAKQLMSDPEHVVVDDSEEVEELDRGLDAELIIQWRMLAHKFVAQSMESDIYLRKQNTKKSWWSFGWASNSNKDENEPGNLTEGDWERLNDIIGYKDGENEQFLAIHERGDVPHTSVEIHMKHNASKLSDSKKCLADLSCDNLDCYAKLYLEAKEFDVRLGSYRLLSPSGVLAASASAHDSLFGAFRYKPSDLKVDWSMVARASPCYVTYLKDSIDEIISFFKSEDVSQTVALETAAAVQMTLDEVRRSAQHQVNRALKNQARFVLDLDIAAPKITIPTNFYPNQNHSTKLLLDLGNLIIRTQDENEWVLPEEKDMYFQFNLGLSDVSAFLVDGDYHWNQVSQNSGDNSSASSILCLLPIIDKCGVIVKLQQIRAENPLFPNTRLSIRLPSLGFHFSPARYHRLMQVAKVFAQDEESTNLIQPWKQADFEGWLSVLSLKGMGGREAVWQRRYICIVGPFLYVLGNPVSKSYKQYISLRGKQLHQLSSDAVGGAEHVLAISEAERPDNKIVEDTNAVVLRCESDDFRRSWQSRLQGAIYRASASAPIAGLLDTSSESEDSEAEHVKSQNLIDSSLTEKVFLTGALDELKISFHYGSQHDQKITKVLLAEERRLFEFRAIGGRVEFLIRGNDMFIGTLLKALEVEDMVGGRGMSTPCYLARSFIKSSDAPSLGYNADQALKSTDFNQDEEDDEFYEAPEILNDESPQSMATDRDYKGSQNLFRLGDSTLGALNFSRVTGLLPGDKVYSRGYNFEAIETLDSFVKAQIVVYATDSEMYDDIDVQVVVTIATLSFYCRRPTIVAIMEFSNAINAKDDSFESLSEASSYSIAKPDISMGDDSDFRATDIVDEPVANGILGRAKTRVIFYLIMNMARAQILLMKEDGTRLATLSQENFLTDLKVFPSSFVIKASLGNLMISDDSLPTDHIYFWACNMRNPGGSSFVELVFCSYSPDDEDYPGYDYSLVGQLSEVRIIYLNRFLQEVVSYFLGLVPSSSMDIVKVKDRSTNTEKSFTKSEIEGSPAMKLDLSLNKPIIIMPRRTDSLNFLKLDVVHITVQNTFKWFLGSKQDIGAVHVEVLTIKVDDINLNVGTGSELGDSIVQDVKGVSVIIQRALRDLLHQIPETEVSVKCDELRAALSSKEYEIITECAQANISEIPNLVPQLKDDFLSASLDQIEPSVHLDSHATTSENLDGEMGITIKVSVVIDLVELSLYYGITRDASLGTLQVSGVWLLYEENARGESFLSSTIRDLSVVDDREGTLEELRLAVRKPVTFGGNPAEVSKDDMNSCGSDRMKHKHEELIPSILILDIRFSGQSTSVALTIQRPQLLVALDFLLDVVEFFVPTVRNMLSDEEEKTSPHVVDAIILDQSVYSQPCAEFSISPLRPLIVDDERFDVFIYDGRGGILLLQDRRGIGLSSPSSEPIIFVGNGKRLQFRNVTVKNGLYLDSCVSLGCKSSYSVSEGDKVFLEVVDAKLSQHYLGETSRSSSGQDVAAGRPAETIFELQAIGPELTFYNASKVVGKSFSLSNMLLHAQLDAFCRLVMEGETVQMKAEVLGFTVESNGVRILEPFDTSVTYFSASGKTNIKLIVSDVFMNFSFSILRLFLAVEEDILAFLRKSSKNMTVACSEFEKIGTIKNPYSGQTCAFWRPRAPPGFAILGDYLTPIDKPPTKGVLAVNTSIVRVKKPKSFRLVWSLDRSDYGSDSNAMDNNELAYESMGNKEESFCSIWFPEAPEGYASMGCVVSPGRTEPPLSSAYCILASLVSPCSLRDCVNVCIGNRNAGLKFWRVDNAVGTFLPENPNAPRLIGRACELRHMLLGFPGISSQGLRIPDRSTPDCQLTGKGSSSGNSVRRFESVATFQLIWWNQGSGSRKKLSIWRPIVPEGMVYFGDIAVRGYETPNSCVVLYGSEEDDLYKCPSAFQLVGQLKKHRGVDSISFWLPQAPPGFVSLGCVACKSTPKISDFSSLRCIRNDMVEGDQFLDESIWDTADIRFMKEPFSIWTTGNDLHTFVVRVGYKRPPRRLALKLADSGLQGGSHDTVIVAEIRTFSAALYDDYIGLMVPLCNLSLSSIGFSLHGSPDYLTSSISCSLSARSYNDKLEAWEPLVESVDGLLRYQYNVNAPGAISQVRLTSTRDLNLNISASNVNMMFQAYASWNSLSNFHESYQEPDRLTDRGRPIIDVHHKQNYHIIPQNKVGQDIFIKVAEMAGFSQVIQMPSGDQKPLKVPVSKNMLDSHLKGNLYGGLKSMVTIIIAKAELPKVEGLSFPQYTAAVHLTVNQSSGDQSLLSRQRAHTTGSASDSSGCSEFEVVQWNEIFYFKVDSVESYTVEVIVTEVGKGDAVGHFSAPLAQISSLWEGSHFSELCELKWLKLHSAESMNSAGEDSRKSSGRLCCAIFLSDVSECKDNQNLLNKEMRPGVIMISPSTEGPWTTMRLNYAAPAACWQFGNDVVASEVGVHDGNIYVTIRSLVSVRNDTDLTLDMRLAKTEPSEASGLTYDQMMFHGNESGQYMVESFETETFSPAVGWVGRPDSLQAALEVELPSGFQWFDEWHIDKNSVNTSDGWVYAPDLQSLKWPESCDPLKSVNYARQRRWVRHRKRTLEYNMPQIPLGTLRPGETLPLPLSACSRSAGYVLQLRPSSLNKGDEYLWSSVVGASHQSQVPDKPEEKCGISVSTLKETEELLCCHEVSGTSSSSRRSLWVCVVIGATEIGTDIYSACLRDWTLVVKSPLSITNCLPLSAEFCVLEMQSSGHFLDCLRGVFSPGEIVKIYNVDIRNPVYMSLLPQRGWLPIHEAVLISHPGKAPSKTISLRSSISGRVVHLILEQNDIKEGVIQPKTVKVYSPYWLSISGCPPLTLRLLDLNGKKSTRKLAFPLQSRKANDVTVEEISDEEIYEGYTIASALNFRFLGLSASVCEFGEKNFGPVKDLSPLGDMDGSVDLCAYNAEGHCVQLFLLTKPSPYQSVPTKVISVRPYITFTNRVGENLFLKLSSGDEPKILWMTDARVSFACCDTGGLNKLQVRLDDTNWSFPVHIVKEDTLTLVMRKHDSTRRFLRTEIRGYEEGSRFIVVFRIGPANGPVRIENRTNAQMKFRQSGFGNDAWIQLWPFSTTNFSWEDPYGQTTIDVEIHDGNNDVVCKYDLSHSGMLSEDGLGFLLHVIDTGDLKIAKLLDKTTVVPFPRDSSGLIIHMSGVGNPYVKSNMQEDMSPLELTVELGALGVSLVDHRPRELSYLYVERVFIAYSTGFDGGVTSRFKLILGYLQLDNQLPLTLMPVLLAPEQSSDINHPVFKMTLTIRNKSVDGVQVFPYMYIRVTDKGWRLNIHEPIIWAYVEFYNNLRVDSVDQSSSVAQVDPEIRMDLIDISEVRLKVSLEPAPAERPQGVLGVWSPILSAVGSAFKIQVHLRKVVRRDRYMRQSSIVGSIQNRLWRDLVHNPLHLIFSVDVLGMTSSTLASLSKGFAELSTDGQFLQLRSKQVWSRRIGGVGDGILQGTEAFAQGVAFGISGVLRKPVENARQNGLLGLAHGLGQAFLGFIVQPVSGALDFFSLTVDGIGASCSRCLEILNNKTAFQRIRNPRAIHSDKILREYNEREANGQMILFLAEASRWFGCTEIFKEPSKYAWSDRYEDHFVVPYQRIVLLTDRRVMLLQCFSDDNLEKKPCKILWDVSWEQILTLELAKAGFSVPSHLIIHVKNFKRSENFVRVIKCATENESHGRAPQAVTICKRMRRIWMAHQSDVKIPAVKNEADTRNPLTKAAIKSRVFASAGSTSDERKLVQHTVNFSKIWSCEQELKGRCTLCRKQVSENSKIFSIWRPSCPDGYVSVGDIAHAGHHPPNVASTYLYSEKDFANPIGFDLVWRNCPDDYASPVSIWHPRAPTGYVSLGCVAVPAFAEPERISVYCIAESEVEEAVFEDQKIWSAPDSYPWACHIYQVQSEALHFVALRQPKEESDWKPMRVRNVPGPSVQLSETRSLYLQS